MKNSVYISILLAIALTCVTYKLISSESAPAVTTDANPAIENIMTRTSVRTYSDREMTKETLDTLLRAAMAAPTAVNRQPWQIVVVTDSTKRAEIASQIGSMAMAADAQASIVLCGDLSLALDGEGKDYWVQDVSAATENLLLAANAVGLGAVWCGIYPIQERVEFFRNLLGLPENVVPLSCVNVGYPSAEVSPKDKWNPAKVHYNQY